MTTRRRLLQSLAAGTAIAALPGSGEAAETGGVKPVPGRDPIDDVSQDYMAFRLAAAEAPLPDPLDFGVGFNWFDHLGSGGLYARNPGYPLDAPVYPDLADGAAWAEIRLALDEMRPGFIRFGLPPDPHCAADGSFRPGTVHLRRLAWLDGWARRNGCTVLLDTFLVPAAHEFPVPANVLGSDSLHFSELPVRYRLAGFSPDELEKQPVFRREIVF
mgnify:CR=1 FL=1